MKTYKVKSSAVRAAKKEMGDNWMDVATIITIDGEFAIELKSSAEMKASQAAINKEVAVIQDLTAIAKADEEKAAKKAEIESRKPVHIPAEPAHKPVAAPSTPKSIPALPAFLKIAPLAATPVAQRDPISAQPETDDVLNADGSAFEPWIVKAGDKAADAIVANSDSARPRMSTTEKPTKKVWHIADAMYMAAKAAGLPMPTRKEVTEECVRQGIAYGTSRTQFQHWFKCYNDSQVAPLATIGADGKIVPPKK